LISVKSIQLEEEWRKKTKKEDERERKISDRAAERKEE